MLSETLATIAQVAMLVFVVTSMAAMGLSLTMDGVIRPLRDLRLVALLLVANFIALSVGAMVLLMVATVLYAPLVVPLVIDGRYTELAAGWAGPAGQVANVGLLLGLGAALLVTWRDVLGAIGSWIFVGTAIVLATGWSRGTSPRGAVRGATRWSPPSPRRSAIWQRPWSWRSPWAEMSWSSRWSGPS